MYMYCLMHYFIIYTHVYLLTNFYPSGMLKLEQTVYYLHYTCLQISGTASRLTRNKSYHHFTLLCKADKLRLKSVLYTNMVNKIKPWVFNLMLCTLCVVLSIHFIMYIWYIIFIAIIKRKLINKTMITNTGYRNSHFSISIHFLFS